jgi:predicted RNA-binding Zn ribbon-like protein
MNRLNMEQSKQVETSTHAGNLDLIGGWVCLDFVNTLDGHRNGHSRDYLGSYDELVLWARHVDLVTEGEARQLIDRARRQPTEASQVFEQALVLREAIYRIFIALASGERPAETDLANLNGALSVALARLQLVPTTDGFAWAWRDEAQDLERLLWPLARSAGELLTSAELNRVRECGGDNCGWLFVDTSRNRSRRWCDMKSCGNRAKAQRHYQRKRTAGHSKP